MFRRIERVRPAGRLRRRRRRWRSRLDGACGRPCRCASTATRAEVLEPGVGILLQAFKRSLELLVAILQLLDETRELAQLVLQPIDPYQKIRGVLLRDGRTGSAQRTAGKCKNGHDETKHHSHLRDRRRWADDR